MGQGQPVPIAAPFLACYEQTCVLQRLVFFRKK